MSKPATSGLHYSFPEMESDSRLKELILYVSQKSQDDPKFGATKLNKILYFVDFLSYRVLDKPVTGTEYRRLSWGPAPRSLKTLRDQMEEDRDLVVEKRKYHNFDQDRTIALRDPDLSRFSQEQISLIDEVIRALWQFNGAEVSLASHGIAWEIADDDESIPYEAAFLMPGGLSVHSRERAREITAEYRASAEAVSGPRE